MDRALAIIAATTYGLCFFALGLSLTVRLTGGQFVPARRRLAAAAIFALLQTLHSVIALWDIASAGAPHDLPRAIILLASYMSLLWFALATDARGERLAIGAGAAICALWIATALNKDIPGMHEAAAHSIAGFPALMVAALVFIADKWFRLDAGRLLTASKVIFAAFFLLALAGLTDLFSLITGDPGLRATVPATHGFLAIALLQGALALSVAVTIIIAAVGIEKFFRQSIDNRADAAEAARAHSEHLYRTIFDTEPECVSILDRACRVIDMNPAGLAMIGVSDVGAVKGRDVIGLVDPAYRDAFKSSIESAFCGQSSRIEFPVGGIMGQRRWIDQRAVPLRDPDGSGGIHAVLAVSRDITDRVQANTALNQITRRLNEAQRVAQIGSWELDLSMNKLFWSDEIFRIFEIDQRQFAATYEAFLALVHPDDREAVNETYQQSLTKRAPYQISHRLVMPDGRIKWVRECGETEYDAHGLPIVSRGTVQDITSQRAVENALAQSQVTLSTFLKVSPEAVIVADADGKIVRFSAGAEATFGYRAREVEGRPIEMLMPERFRAAHPDHMRGFAASKEAGRTMASRSEIRGLRKSGEEFPAEASIARVTTPAGVLFATVLRDTTRQKAAHQAMVEARIAAEAASEAKSRFIANMNHELRTPLNAIIGFSEILMAHTQMPLSEKSIEDYARHIHEGGQHLLRIVNDILELSRIDLGDRRVEEEPVEARAAFSDAVRILQGRAADACEGIVKVIPDGLPLLHADRTLLTQALLNLLSNAIKFGGNRGTILAGAETTHDGGVRLFVHDQGVGMSADLVKRIGEPFLQADSRLSRQFEGTGLGLTIVKRIMQLHGGALEVASVLKEGTTVSLVFPKARVLGEGAANEGTPPDTDILDPRRLQVAGGA